jgi:hypothetical protein
MNSATGPGIALKLMKESEQHFIHSGDSHFSYYILFILFPAELIYYLIK